MSSIRNKVTAFQRPAKFNFLERGRSAPRREWPLGLSPAAARDGALRAEKRGAK